jgi:hypothetical protein
MKFVLGIKPTIITGWGTTFHAKARVRESIRGCFCYSSQFGSAYTNALGGNPKYVYGYNIEVFKRGKYRKDKHYVIYKYTFPIEMFNLLNVEIKQGSRTFKIMPKKK